MVEGMAQPGWPSCIPDFLSSLESSLPNIWSTHLARTSAYWGHPHFQPITDSPERLPQQGGSPLP